MKEVLIINLTRMGDLLQTTPLMAGLKRKYPGLRITLLINSAFTGICKGIRPMDDLITFDMKDYSRRVTEGRHSLVENIRVLEKLIERVNQREYNLAINVTHSPISAIITSLINSRKVSGFTIDTEGHRLIKHPWMRYFFNVIPARRYNPFHLVDIYLKIGETAPDRKGLLYEIPDGEKGKGDLILRENGITGRNLIVGLHLGASKSDKAWSVSSYVKLAELIYKQTGASILIFGSDDEIELAGKFVAQAKIPCIDLAGKTGLGELAAILKRCSLFVTNDTGPLHIATAVGTKVIDISTANVHFIETGPYGDGHYVVQAELPCVPCAFDVNCHDRVCKSMITPEVVFEIAKMALKGENDLNIPDSALWKDLQVYRSYFEDDGYLSYVPLLRRPINRENLYRIIYRHVWNMMDDSENSNATSASEKIINEINSCYVDSKDGLIDHLEGETDALKNMIRLSKEGLRLTGLIAGEAGKNDQDIGLIKEIWQKIERIDEQIDLVGHANPCFMPLITVFRYSREAMTGDGMQELSEALSQVYNDFIINMTNMYQITNQLLLSKISRTGRLLETTNTF